MTVNRCYHLNIIASSIAVVTNFLDDPRGHVHNPHEHDLATLCNDFHSIYTKTTSCLNQYKKTSYASLFLYKFTRKLANQLLFILCYLTSFIHIKIEKAV